MGCEIMGKTDLLMDSNQCVYIYKWRPCTLLCIHQKLSSLISQLLHILSRIFSSSTNRLCITGYCFAYNKPLRDCINPGVYGTQARSDQTGSVETLNGQRGSSCAVSVCCPFWVLFTVLISSLRVISGLFWYCVLVLCQRLLMLVLMIQQQHTIIR